MPSFDDLIAEYSSLFLTSRPTGARPARATVAPVSFRDPAWDAAESAASAATGVPLNILRSIRVNGERSNGNQVSPKGARGVYQFMPGTRNAFLKKYGVDAYSSDPNEQALAAAHHLAESYGRTKDWSRAVAGYNGGLSGERGTNRTAENINYVKRVMGGLPSVAATASPVRVSDASAYDDAWRNDRFAMGDEDSDQQIA